MRVSRFARYTGLCLLLSLGIPCAADTVHVMARGETLYGIARSYGISLETLMVDNDIPTDEVTKVPVGTRLVIRQTAVAAAPATRSYTVQPGDTLYQLARREGCTVGEIEALNPGVDPRNLKVGTVILLPAGGSEPQMGDDPATAAQPPEAAGDASRWPHPGKRTVAQRNHVRWVQIAGERGDDIVAVASGRVVWSAPYTVYRNVVIIEVADAGTGDAYRFWYAGNEEVYVRSGDWVEKGTVIAGMGIDPFDGAARVSFAVTKGLKVVDHTVMSWQ